MQTRSRILRSALWISLGLASLGLSLSCAMKVEGKTLAEWNALLEKGTPEQQIEAAMAVAQFGTRAKSSIPILFERNTPSRGYAVTKHFQRALRKIGRDVDLFLLNKLDDPEETVRAHAAYTFYEIGVQSPANVPSIVSALGARVRDEFWYARMCALRALGRFGVWALPAMPSIARALEDENGKVRLEAVIALHNLLLSADAMDTGTLRESAAGAIPALVRLIDDDFVAEHRVADNPIRDWAILTLAEFGPKAAPAVPRLKQLLNDSGLYSKGCRIQTAAALYRIETGDKAYKDIVVQGVFEAEPEVKETAVGCLLNLGEVDDSVLEEIIGIFLGEGTSAAFVADQFLSDYLSEHPEKIPLVRKRLEALDPETAARIESWLGDLQEDGEEN